jgi:uncharacterized protein (TIGR03435 family)
VPGTLKSVKVLPAVICAIAASVLHAQTRPSFDAASIHASRAEQSSAHIRFSDRGFLVENCTLTFIIQRAYGLRDFQVTGGPGWAADGTGDRFDIQARTNAATSGEEMKMMAQTLLADRFRLKAHRETKPVPVYALAIAKSGLRLRAPRPDEHRSIESYPGTIEATNAPMTLFIDELSGKVDRPVIDSTGLTAGFDFTLRWSAGIPGRADPGLGSIFAAIQDQLGLKLEAEKRPFEILIIDSIERPSAN